MFWGKVRYIVDGDGFCLSTSADPNTWIEVRLVDFDSPELDSPEGRRGKDILEQAIMDKQVSCTTTPGRSGRTTTYDRVLATCRVGGVALGSLLKKLRAPEGGN